MTRSVFSRSTPARSAADRMPLRGTRRRVGLGRTVRGAAALVAALACTAAVAPASQAKIPLNTPFELVAGNPVEQLIDLPLDEQVYDEATHCVKNPTKGALAMVKWLPKVSPRGVNWGINRCEMWGKHSASLHAEGRAIDWHLDVHDKADRADAEHLIDLLMAPDSLGEPHALANRLGVQGLIWDCRAWFGGDEFRKYSACSNPKVDDTTAHRNHVHIELNKAGAKLQSSWWTQGPGRAVAKSVK
jgi:hypothetical protein